MNSSAIESATSKAQAELVSCDVCGSNGIIRKFGLVLHDGPYSDPEQHRMRNFFECPHCGHMSVDVFEPDRHDDYYRGLQMTYYDQHDHDVRRYRHTLDLLPRERVNRILDIGCGTGTFLTMFPDSIERCGIELSGIAAQKATEKGVKILSFEDVQKPGVCGTFDVVTALDVVEHAKDLARLRKCFYDALRPGGTLLLLTGDRSSASARRLGRYWYYTHYAEHVSFFSRRSVRCWLDPAFENIEVIPTDHHPSRFAEIIAITRSWFLFPAKLIASKLPGRPLGKYIALWTTGDHMLVRAVRRK